MTLNFESYLKSIQSDLRRGNATEHTYRSALETLIESAGKGIDASNDPKHIECGAPDFIVERRKVPLGYIETKDIGTDLNKIEKSEQMKRYLKALHNLILTDYIEFRWYVNGERRAPIHLATRTGKDRLVPNPLGMEKLTELLEGFFATETPTVNTPKELAERLASVTHFIAEQIEFALASGDADVKHALEEQYLTFTDLLLPELKAVEFADLYAQTVTYGLFAAKITAPENDTFTLEDAYKYLRRIPFLRTLFLNVNEQLDEIEIIRPYLQDIVSLLNRSNIHEILADFGKHTRTEDPVVHFYETFLAKYDSKLRESRGVYYTPEPVVQFIVRSVDEILKTRFNKPWGLADDSVKVLDPAAGTGTFLYYVIQRVHDEIVNVRGQGGQWKEKSRAMLKRLFGFELLIPPYTISHLKLGLLMDELGAPLEGKDDRVHVYLTNTLEEGVHKEGLLPGLGHGIAKESSEAAKVKQDDDIIVVLGNPPYSNFGMMNKGIWITELIQEYKEGLREKKINLDDDFIKFIRYAQWRVIKAGRGVIALITNNTYLDGLTHRMMRKSLLNTFDEIFILDLHGSTRKNEKTPTGETDENVFDIQQGVSVFLAIRNIETNNTFSHQRAIKHYSVWGLRQEKYDFLQNNNINNISWGNVEPVEPNYYLNIHNSEFEEEYKKGFSLLDIFQYKNSAVQTKKDSLSIHFQKAELENALLEIRKLDIETIRRKFNLGDDGRDWSVKLAKKDVMESKGELCQIVYKPFDFRWTYFTGKSKGFIAYPRSDLFKYMNKPNIALASVRQVVGVEEACEIIVSEFMMTDRSMFSTHGTPYLFPLYIYPSEENSVPTLFSRSETSRTHNITNSFLSEISKKNGLIINIDGKADLTKYISPEDVFYYIYAIFHSPTYRTRYAEFLKIDFPRIPLTGDKALFAALARKGKELVDLHLLRSPKVENFITTYPVSGDNRVEKVRYEDGKVWINPAQYFGGVPEAVWNFKIGGYQVCDKWLKDRKGRVLSSEDISHYQRVVVALNETIRLMKEIDEKIPKWPIE